MKNPVVSDLLTACPFLEAALRNTGLVHDDDFELGTVIFGATAGLLIRHELTAAQMDKVFDYFNVLAERGDAEELDTLGTGAIELFNDDPQSQRLARQNLSGEALEMLESCRVSWGQPDYGHAHD